MKTPSGVAAPLVAAADAFRRAQTLYGGTRVPAKKHRRGISKLLMAAWTALPEDDKVFRGDVTIPAADLYALLHQAVQTLPGEDD